MPASLTLFRAVGGVQGARLFAGGPRPHGPLKTTPATICLITGPVRPMIPNGIRIRSAVFPQCTGQTDGLTYVRTCTYGPTDRQIVHGKV